MKYVRQLRTDGILAINKGVLLACMRYCLNLHRTDTDTYSNLFSLASVASPAGLESLSFATAVFSTDGQAKWKNVDIMVALDGI
jgi:hypothetical protein